MEYSQNSVAIIFAIGLTFGWVLSRLHAAYNTEIIMGKIYLSMLFWDCLVSLGGHNFNECRKESEAHYNECLEIYRKIKKIDEE